MATLDIQAKIDATDYGDVGDGGDNGKDHIREVWFGPAFGGHGPNHFDIRNIKVGTSGYGSSDLWAPSLSGMGNFDGFAGSGANPSFSGGIMSFNNTADRYGYKDLGANHVLIYVQFELRVYSDDLDPDYHDISVAGGAISGFDDDGIYNGGFEWRFDGHGNSFGTGAIKDGTTWQTINLLWSYATVLTADFTASPLTGFAPLSVDFEDASIPGSSGAITAWDFDFGDGSPHGTGPGPWNHTYSPGSYSPQLTVTSPDGTDSMTKTDYVVVSDAGSGNWLKANCEADDAYLEKDVAFGTADPNSISRVGTPTSAAAESVSLPSGIVAGDLILMFVSRFGSRIQPTVPSGWTPIATGSNFSTAGSWIGVYYRMATGSDTSGTWTDASALSCSAYRNAVEPSGSFNQARLGWADSTFLSYASQVASGGDWLVAFSMSETWGCDTTPTGFSVPSGFTEHATRGVYDTAGPASNYAGQAVSGSPSQNYGTAVVYLHPTLVHKDWWFQFDTAPISATMAAISPDGSSGNLVVLDGKANDDEGLYMNNSFSGSPPGGWRWRDLQQGQLTGAGIPFDAVHTVEMHFVPTNGPDQYGGYFGTMEVYVDGTHLHESFGGNPSWGSYLIPGTFGVGGMYANHDHCERYFITRIKVGTTRHGTDIFEDDFSSGDFSNWSRTIGDVSVVPGPKGCNPPGHIILDPSNGCPGTVIHVTGHGFTPGDALTAQFNNNPIGFSESTVASDGTVDGTFVVPNTGCGTYFSGFQLTTPDETSFGDLVVTCPTVTLTPASGPPGTLVTVHGTCFNPGDTVGASWYEGEFFRGWPAYFIKCLWGSFDGCQGPRVTVGSDGTFTATFTVPTEARAGDWVDLASFGGTEPPQILFNSDSGSGASGYFTPCVSVANAEFEYIDASGTTGAPSDAKFLRPATGTITVGYGGPGPAPPDLEDVGSIVDWLATDTDFWLLTNVGASGSSFPPPDPSTEAPMVVYRIPKDGSAHTEYPVGLDLPWEWEFDSGGDDTVGCFGLAQNAGVNCTPGATGYWWRVYWWFVGYRKRVMNARLATDGTNVWVAAITFETEPYPYITSDDGDVSTACDWNHSGTNWLPSQTDQFIDLETVTSNFTTFVTDLDTARAYDPVQPCGIILANFNDYQRWQKWGKGTLGFGAARAPESDAGDHGTGYYQRPRLSLFHLSGGAFSKIGEDPSQFIVGYRDHYNNDTSFGWMSLAASPAEPGACHAVWSEMGSYGRVGGGSGDNNFDVWDGGTPGIFGSGKTGTGEGAPNIGARVSYSKWSASAMVSQHDLWTGHQDRSGWYYHYNDGSGTEYYADAGTPPGMDFTDLFELKNEHGWPALLMAFYKVEDNLINYVVSGHAYSRVGSEDVVRYFDLRTGSPVQLQATDSSFLPTLADMIAGNGGSPTYGSGLPVTVPNAIYQPQASGQVDANFLIGWLWPNGGTYFEKGLATTRMYPDETLGGAHIYGVSVILGFLSGSVSQASQFLRIRADGSQPFEFLDGDRDSGLRPTVNQPGYAPAGRDYVYDPLSLWVPNHGMVNYPNEGIGHFDRGPCKRGWETMIFLGYGDSGRFSGGQPALQWLNTHGSPFVENGLVIYPGYVEEVPSFGHTLYVEGLGAVKILDHLCSCPAPLATRFFAEGTSRRNVGSPESPLGTPPAGSAFASGKVERGQGAPGGSGSPPASSHFARGRVRRGNP